MTPTPILIPGNMCDARMWPTEVRAVLPGARDADTTQDDTIAGMAARALALTDGPIVPVGFSMGGIVALAMAKAAPHRIVGMVLMDTNATADLPERAHVRPRQQEAVRAGGLAQIVVEQLKPHYLAAQNRGDPALLDLLRDMAVTLGEQIFIQQSEALRTRQDLSDVLPTLAVPVLIACGAEDRLCPPAWHQRLAATARDATLHVVEGAGHMLPLEQPEILARMIARWAEGRE